VRRHASPPPTARSDTVTLPLHVLTGKAPAIRFQKMWVALGAGLAAQVPLKKSLTPRTTNQGFFDPEWA